VGGGAAGAIAAIHLERRAGRRVRVVIIEPRAELGGGVAYSTTDLGHLLNVRAECLSALPDQPGHFSAWAAQRTPTNGQPFLPRAWYGQYLRSLLGQVEHIRARAAHVGPCAAGVQIALSNGTNLIVDRVVLATGPSPTTFPEGLGGGELRWIEDPWVPGVLDGLRPDEPVLLLGTGLTAVDVCLSLQVAGHRQMFATSRHGLLPASHPQEAFAQPLVVPPLKVSARSLLAWARTMAEESGDWRLTADGLRTRTDELWGTLADVEQARLLRHVRRRWEILRHRMPPSVADRIGTMRETGQLTIVPGGVRSAQNTTSEVNVTLVDRQLRVGAVINCTGPCVDVRRTRDPLIRCLLESGVARPGPLNLGLETGVGGCLPGTNDALWVVGPLRKGRQWETTAIPDIRTQAAELPHSIRQTDVFVGV
jgi:uncharacterized NAD(P)/FAD-binding protein YdhS